MDLCDVLAMYQEHQQGLFGSDALLSISVFML